ncbi:MAG TPA: exodeoxyribonuclease III [Actinomycetota bacterium]
MRIVTWNVNSIKQRLPRLLALLDREAPDIVCLQETKCPDEAFPHEQLAERGYHAATYGQRAYNGVAVLSREAPLSLERGFTADPTPDEARLLTARYDALTVISAYVINGRAIGDPAYERKLAWLDALRAWIAGTFSPEEPLVLAGDFNVAPEARDVHDPAGWEGSIHFSEPERTRVRALLDWGFADLLRRHTTDGGIFTWWDYRAGAFHKGWGLRIDLILGTEPLAGRVEEVRVDRNERRPKAGEGAPSDHAPVIATLAD